MREVICGICGKTYVGKSHNPTFTVRESWIQAGGWGSIPDAAIVRPTCDVKEQRLLKSGKLKLAQLWNRTQPTGFLCCRSHAFAG
jgi:hypothetical protein